MNIGPTRFNSRGGKLRWSIYVETCETAVSLFDPDTDEPLATVTVCLPANSPRAPDDCIWIKDWSENDGMFKAMVDAGVVIDTGQFAPCGHCVANLGKLTPEAIEERDAAFDALPGLLQLRDKVYPREMAHG